MGEKGTADREPRSGKRDGILPSTPDRTLASAQSRDLAGVPCNPVGVLRFASAAEADPCAMPAGRPDTNPRSRERG
jgi:hypothetical protein